MSHILQFGGVFSSLQKDTVFLTRDTAFSVTDLYLSMRWHIAHSKSTYPPNVNTAFPMKDAISPVGEMNPSPKSSMNDITSE